MRWGAPLCTLDLGVPQPFLMLGERSFPQPARSRAELLGSRGKLRQGGLRGAGALLSIRTPTLLPGLRSSVPPLLPARIARCPRDPQPRCPLPVAGMVLVFPGVWAHGSCSVRGVCRDLRGWITIARSIAESGAASPSLHRFSPLNAEQMVRALQSEMSLSCLKSN